MYFTNLLLKHVIILMVLGRCVELKLMKLCLEIYMNPIEFHIVHTIEIIHYNYTDREDASCRRQSQQGTSRTTDNRKFSHGLT